MIQSLSTTTPSAIPVTALDPSLQILSDITVFTKYAKHIPELQRRETWNEIVDRNKQMHLAKFTHLGEEFLNQIEHAYQYVYSKQVVPSMRSLQFGGLPMEINNARGFNCSFQAIDHWKAFPETMFLLLSGCGVGFSVQQHHIDKLPAIQERKDRTYTYLIGDSIIGWADAVKMLLKSYFFGKSKIKFDYRDIRPKGAMLITSGGKAPGPEPLRKCLDNLDAILSKKNVGDKLTSIEVHDMICFIADAVLAGGIRRAALISLFDKNDEVMLLAKSNFNVLAWDYVWEDSHQLNEDGSRDKVKKASVTSEGKVKYDIVLTIDEPGYGLRENVLIQDVDEGSLNWYFSDANKNADGEGWMAPWYLTQSQRGRANNSVVLLREDVTEEEFKSIMKKVEASDAGEPGVYWTNDVEYGANPCFAGDQRLLTTSGYKTFRELWEQGGKQEYSPEKTMDDYGTLDIINEDGQKKATNVYRTSHGQQLYRVTLKDGTVIRATSNHRFLVSENNNIVEKRLHELVVGDELPLYLSATTTSIVSIEEDGIEETFCLTEPDTTRLVVNGIRIGNCVEIALLSNQFCNLTEINGVVVNSQEHFNTLARVASFLGTLQAAYTDFHYLRPVWRRNTEAEALLGVSVTGIATPILLALDESEAAKAAVEQNEITAKEIGINPAARITCVKPSGTTSCVLGTSSGIHAWHNDYYIRRMRINKNESLYTYMKLYHPELIEDDLSNPAVTGVASFYIAAPEGAILRTESMMDSLERVKRFNQNWVAVGHKTGANKHNVSATISVKSDEWNELSQWMWDNQDGYTGISVLPYNGGTYVQAPFEDITKEVYEASRSKVGTIDLTRVIEMTDATNLADQVACAGGVCEIV